MPYNKIYGSVDFRIYAKYVVIPKSSKLTKSYSLPNLKIWIIDFKTKLWLTGLSVVKILISFLTNSSCLKIKTIILWPDLQRFYNIWRPAVLIF